jgi:hypothetical protein
MSVGGIKLLYLYLDPLTGTFNSQFIDAAHPYAFFQDIAVLSTGAVVIAYRDMNTALPTMAVVENTGFGSVFWNMLIIGGTLNFNCNHPSMTVTSGDNVHLVFEGAQETTLPYYIFYSHRTSTYLWSNAVPISGSIGGVIPKIASDIFGNLHVVYQQRVQLSMPGNIIYTGNVSGSWVQQVLQSGSNYDPSIAVDNFGNCNMAYFHYTTGNGDVYYYGYINPGTTPSLSLNLTPNNPPIQIPAAGGNFTYNISLTNIDNYTSPVDVWTEAILPNGSTYGPILFRSGLNIAPGQTVARNNINQTIPGTAPSGQYYYVAKAGLYPSVVTAADTFAFTKLGVDGNSKYTSWGVTGWDEPAALGNVSEAPSVFGLSPAYPNPFNAHSTIEFTLNRDDNVSLIVYDITGKEAAVLADGYYAAGNYSVQFDGSDLSSGVYFARLTVNGQAKTEKLMLIK